MPRAITTPAETHVSVSTGHRFLVNVPVSDQTAAALLTVITNWEAALKK